MADRGSLRPWPDLPPGQKALPGTRAWSMLRTLRARGWLRPRRLGCLFLVLLLLLFLVLWLLGSAVNGISEAFRNDPPPVAGSPFDTVAPSRPPTSAPPGADLITHGRLIVAVQEVPGLAERASGSSSYTGFDIALLDLIARNLGVDPARTSFKPVPASIGAGMLARREADLALGGFEITPGQDSDIGIVGPYLVSPVRLAAPSNSPATSLGSLGDGTVCAPRDSPAAAALADRLGDRLKTRSGIGACADLLGGGSVQAIAGDQIALNALPGMKSGTLHVLGGSLGTTEYGIGVAPGDRMLRDRVSAALRKAVDDGTWARLYAQYLGTPVPPAPTIR